MRHKLWRRLPSGPAIPPFSPAVSGLPQLCLCSRLPPPTAWTLGRPGSLSPVLLKQVSRLSVARSVSGSGGHLGVPHRSPGSPYIQVPRLTAFKEKAAPTRLVPGIGRRLGGGWGRKYFPGCLQVLFPGLQCEPGWGHLASCLGCPLRPWALRGVTRACVCVSVCVNRRGYVGAGWVGSGVLPWVSACMSARDHVSAAG